MRGLIAIVVLSLVTGPVWSAEPRSKKGQIDDEAKAATTKAMEWLAAKQNADGSWGDPAYPNNTAITGFALMAFMSQGHLPNQGKYGPEVAKGLRFLLASDVGGSGYLIGTRRGNMYCHGMATLMKYCRIMALYSGGKAPLSAC